MTNLRHQCANRKILTEEIELTQDNLVEVRKVKNFIDQKICKIEFKIAAAIKAKRYT